MARDLGDRVYLDLKVPIDWISLLNANKWDKRRLHSDRLGFRQVHCKVDVLQRGCVQISRPDELLDRRRTLIGRVLSNDYLQRGI